jgi:hypothetical protein
MTLMTVFLGAPGNSAAELRAFLEAVGEINEAEGMARGRLFVPVNVSRKGYPQEVIEDNIRHSRYYVLALEDTIGVAGNTFERDLWVARRCLADPNLEMKDVVVFLKELAPGQPLQAGAGEFREAVRKRDGLRVFDFADASEFKANMRALLSTWLAMAINGSSLGQLNCAIKPIRQAPSRAKAGKSELTSLSERPIQLASAPW